MRPGKFSGLIFIIYKSSRISCRFFEYSASLINAFSFKRLSVFKRASIEVVLPLVIAFDDVFSFTSHA